MKHIVLLLCLLLTMMPSNADQLIKQPNVAGGFYSGNSKQLQKEIQGFLDKVPDALISSSIKILIGPHAGYRYSGQVAAYGYKAVSNQNISTVIVVSPSHYYSFEGLSVWPQGGFKTPLGVIDVNEGLAKQLLDVDKRFVYKPEVFDKEHGLEIHLPFIQTVFPQADIVPVILGTPDPNIGMTLANALEMLIGNRDDILVVISADLSHYHSYEKAVGLDQDAIKAVLEYDYQRIWDSSIRRTMEIDAFHAVVATLLYAQKKEYEPKLLKYANSGDVTGDKSRVVGYSSIVFADNRHSEERSNEESLGFKPLTKEQKKELIDIARRTVEHYVKTGKKLDVKTDDSRLTEKEGAFVTLHKKGALRGCIGHIIGHQPLYKTVRDVAVSAAAEDPRFDPVDEQELEMIDVEVSVLSVPQTVKNIEEIEMGKHGVILSRGLFNRGVFLPQVATETGWDRDEFLSQLASQKAGLDRDAWKKSGIKLEIFTADVFNEKDVH